MISVSCVVCKLTYEHTTASFLIVQPSVIKQYKQKSHNVIPMLLFTNRADSVNNVATSPRNCSPLTGEPSLVGPTSL